MRVGRQTHRRVLARQWRRLARTKLKRRIESAAVGPQGQQVAVSIQVCSRSECGLARQPDHANSIWGRRYRDLAASFASDLAQDDGSLSEGQRALIRRASALCLECEFLEAKFAHNGGADADSLNLFQRTANSLRRIIESLGTQHGRLSKDIGGVTLGDLIKQDQAEERQRLAAERQRQRAAADNDVTEEATS
jgi:hypothetical protein